jgi:hypothetical protein
MEAKGTKFNPNDGAHHIVPGRDKKGTVEAQAARDILDDYQIDINQAENGVRLPPDDHYKTGLHSGGTYKETYRRLDDIVTFGQGEGLAWGQIREALLVELQDIGNLMAARNYP